MLVCSGTGLSRLALFHHWRRTAIELRLSRGMEEQLLCTHKLRFQLETTMLDKEQLSSQAARLKSAARFMAEILIHGAF